MQEEAWRWARVGGWTDPEHPQHAAVAASIADAVRTYKPKRDAVRNRGRRATLVGHA